MSKMSEYIRKLMDPDQRTNIDSQNDKVLENLNEIRDFISPTIADTLDEDVLFAVSKTKQFETCPMNQMQIDFDFIFDKPMGRNRQEEGLEEMDTDECRTKLPIPKLDVTENTGLHDTANINESQPLCISVNEKLHPVQKY